MRAWGITIIAVAVGCTVLPPPLAFVLVGFVATAGVVALIVQYVERRDQLAVVQRASTTGHLGWLQQMRDLQAETEAEWSEFVPTDSSAPLGARSIPIDQLRSVAPKVPQQRQSGAAS